MQVDPIKPTLKPPGMKRLKLKHDGLLSSFAFKFNLRRYTEECGRICGRGTPAAAATAALDNRTAGRTPRRAPTARRSTSPAVGRCRLNR